MKSICRTTQVLLAGGLMFFRRPSARGLPAEAAAVFIGSVLCLLALGWAGAEATVLDFEDLSGMTFFSGTPFRQPLSYPTNFSLPSVCDLVRAAPNQLFTMGIKRTWIDNGIDVLLG